MANLWHNSEDEGWERTAVPGAAILRGGSIECIDIESIDRAAEDALCGEVVLYQQRSNTHSPTWLLLAPPDSGVCINNMPLWAGIRAQDDRDSIRLPGFPTLYFSTEHLAQVEAFPSPESVFCPRCKLKISTGDMAVRCPQCQVWHHEQVADERCCWSYSGTCALCDQATDLESARFRWTPEAL